MTVGNPRPEEHPPYFSPTPGGPPSKQPYSTLVSTVRCLVGWPAIFGMAVIASFVGVAIHFNDPGGPLFWPCSYIGSAIMYALIVGLPLSLCAKRRRWYIRVIPVVIAAVPVGWAVSMAGAWAVPGALIIALSIAVETTGRHHRWTACAARWLTTPWRRPDTSI